jgi:DNA (cytosine-5)-methyltransferase 1
VVGMHRRSVASSVAAVDLFCGVGGLTYGLLSAGIDVRLGVDVDPSCEFPFVENNGAAFSRKSVKDVGAKEVVEAWSGSRYKLLAGCAPCQPFSTYSQAWDPSSDDRWPLLLEFARLAKETEADFITMENVPQLERQVVFKVFVSTLQELRFKVSFKVVNCADYGVPQLRHRLVLLASRHGEIALVPPVAEHDRVTVRKAIGNLAPLAAGEISGRDPLHQTSGLSETNLRRIRASKPGGTWRDWPAHLRANCHSKSTGKGYISVYGRMNWDEPSPTMTTQFYGFGSGRFGHPEQDRAISLREGAILQSFPKGYKFVRPGDPIEMKIAGRLIGNAVPVKLGRAIGRSVLLHAEQIGGGY